MPSDDTEGGASSSSVSDRYEVGQVIGSGGMGIVVAAHDAMLDRRVAIKLLADNLALDAEARERFTREARAAARLNHPHVVQIFDVGEEDGRPYIVMELVEGGSLADRLRTDERLPYARVGEVAAQGLAALEHAHDAGLLHRDIKPANLLLGRDGLLKVTDFGVAEVAEAPGLTRTGHVLGTLSYLAPERLRGEPASPASDLYSLAATLHELAAGSPPGGDATLPPDLPSGLSAMIRACLDPDPAARPSSVAQARRLLEGREPTRPIAADETVAIAPRTEPVAAEEPPRPGLVERGAAVVAWLRRQSATRLVLGSIAVLVLLALIALSGGSGTTRADDERAEETAEDVTVEPIERGDDAATTARNIADWIRRHSGD